jgi:hypothetical protein
MQLHLNEIATKITPGAHAILLLDQAGWHGAKALKVPSNISLLQLPPRAPELNGQENIWQFMRQNWLSNRIFKSFDDIVDHCCYAWNTLISLLNVRGRRHPRSELRGNREQVVGQTDWARPPGPPPFSSINSTPALSKAHCSIIIINYQGAAMRQARFNDWSHRRSFIGGSDARIIMGSDEASLIRLLA